MASESWFIFGDSRLSWEVFSDLALTLPGHFLAENPEYAPNVDIAILGIASRNVIKIALFHFDHSNAYTLFSVVSALSQLHRAINPRDKVYSLYSLLDGFVENLPLVNYSLECNKIYLDFTLATIESTRIFWPAQIQFWRTQPVQSLPSWVPDFDRAPSHIVSELPDCFTETVKETGATRASSINAKLLLNASAETLPLAAS